MPRGVGPERAHFGGEDGLVSEITNGVTKYLWRCIHCGYEIGGKVFPNAKARIHLSGDNSLRNGIISQVCTRASDDIKKKFVAIIKEKQEQKDFKVAKRKRAQELKRSNSWSSPAKQSKLGLNKRNTLKDRDVDDAWGRAFFGLDISFRKIDKPLFRSAIEASQKSKLL